MGAKFFETYITIYKHQCKRDKNTGTNSYAIIKDNCSCLLGATVTKKEIFSNFKSGCSYYHKESFKTSQTVFANTVSYIQTWCYRLIPTEFQFLQYATASTKQLMCLGISGIKKKTTCIKCLPTLFKVGHTFQLLLNHVDNFYRKRYQSFCNKDSLTVIMALQCGSSRQQLTAKIVNTKWD